MTGGEVLTIGYERATPARLLATLVPSLIRKGMARMNPVRPGLVDAARARIRRGKAQGVHKP